MGWSAGRVPKDEMHVPTENEDDSTALNEHLMSRKDGKQPHCTIMNAPH